MPRTFNCVDCSIQMIPDGHGGLVTCGARTPRGYYTTYWNMAAMTECGQCAVVYYDCDCNCNCNCLHYSNCTNSTVITLNNDKINTGEFTISDLSEKLSKMSHIHNADGSVSPGIPVGKYDLPDLVKKLATMSHTNTITDITNTCFTAHGSVNCSKTVKVTTDNKVPANTYDIKDLLVKLSKNAHTHGTKTVTNTCNRVNCG